MTAEAEKSAEACWGCRGIRQRVEPTAAAHHEPAAFSQNRVPMAGVPVILSDDMRIVEGPAALAVLHCAGPRTDPQSGDIPELCRGAL